MVPRTGAEVQVIDKFDGVNDVVDHFNLAHEYSPWAIGGYFTERRTFRRLRGKKTVNAAGTVDGRVLSLASLVFRQRTIVVRHSSSVYITETDLSGVVSSPGSTVTTDAFMDD